MMQSSPEQLHSFPASKALILIELVKRWDVSAAQLLYGQDLEEAALGNSDCRLSLSVFRALVARAQTLTREPGLGFYSGLHKRLSMYDSVDFAVSAVKTLGEALTLVVRYTPLITTAMSFRLQVEGATAALLIDENAELGVAREYSYFSLLTSVWPMAKFFIGKNPNESVCFAFPEPPYYSRFSHLMPETRFDQPQTQILLGASLLESPFVALDRASVTLAREQCERDLVALGFGQAIVERVRSALHKPDGFRSNEEVATALSISPRTLRRQLAAKHINFSELLEQERREKALLLLASSSYTLEDVTEYLGYSTVSSFVRAFRRWTGKTPTKYRHITTRKHLEEIDGGATTTNSH